MRSTVTETSFVVRCVECRGEADETVTIAEAWTGWSGGGDEVLPHCPQRPERHLGTGDPIESHYSGVTYHSNVTIAFGCLVVVASLVRSLSWFLGLAFVGLPDLGSAIYSACASQSGSLRRSSDCS